MNLRQARQVLDDGKMADRPVGVRMDAIKAALMTVAGTGRHGVGCASPALTLLELADPQTRVGEHIDLMAALRSAAAVLEEAEKAERDRRAVSKSSPR